MRPAARKVGAGAWARVGAPPDARTARGGYVVAVPHPARRAWTAGCVLLRRVPVRGHPVNRPAGWGAAAASVDWEARWSGLPEAAVAASYQMYRCWVQETGRNPRDVPYISDRRGVLGFRGTIHLVLPLDMWRGAGEMYDVLDARERTGTVRVVAHRLP